MPVDVDRDLDRLLQSGHQLPRRLRAQQPGRVLDDDVVGAHVDQSLRERAPKLDAVGWGDCVAQRALHPLLGLERGSDRGLHVAEVVQRVEDAEDVDSVFGRVLDEELDRVVGEVAIGDQVLAADEGLDRSVRRRLVQLAEVSPWIFAPPHLRLEGGAAERLHRGKPDGIHLAGVAKRGVEQAYAGRLLRGHVARAARFSRCRCATAPSEMPMMRAASQAAFLAPASPMATVATGIPAGICTIAYRESTPPRCCVGTGTPITGRSVQAATTPGRCAAPPAAAITTFSPRSRAEVAHSMTPLGFRWAEQTLTSCINSSSSRTLTQDSISGKSDLEPRMMPTRSEERR